MENRIKYTKQIGLLVIVLGLFVWTNSAFAQGNIHIGRFQVSPGISYNGEYNDNIFSEKTGEESDFIHTITPEIKVLYPGTTQDNFFAAGYQVGVALYSDFTDTNYEDHRLFMNLGYRSPKGFYVKAGDDFQHTADPYGSISQFRIGEQTKRWNNDLKLTAGYGFADRYAVEIIFNNLVERFDRFEDQFEDHMNNAFSLVVTYEVISKTSILAEFRQTNVAFNEQNDGIDLDHSGVVGSDEWNSGNSQDHSLNDFFLGVRIEPGGKFKGEAKVGFQTISFDNQLDRNGNPYNDDSAPVTEINISYIPAPRTTIFLIARMSKEVSYSADVDTDVSASYTDTYGQLGLIQKIMDKLTLNASISGDLNDYHDVKQGNPDKSFVTQSFNLNLDYEIKKWINTGAFYLYTNKSASDVVYENNEYISNRLGFYVKLRF